MRAKRTDANQFQIVKGLRNNGFNVFVTSAIGFGFPDIVVSGGHSSQNYLFEIKDGDKPLAQQKLTVAEQKFHDTWPGQVAIIASLEEALDYLTKDSI